MSFSRRSLLGKYISDYDFPLLNQHLNTAKMLLRVWSMANENKKITTGEKSYSYCVIMP